MPGFNPDDVEIPAQTESKVPRFDPSSVDDSFLDQPPAKKSKFGESREEKLNREMSRNNEYQPEELPFIDQVVLESSDNLEEQEKYLQKRYPNALIEREPQEDGSERLAITGGPSPAKLYPRGGFLPSVVADAPEMVGAAGGAAELGLLGVTFGGPIGGVLGAGLGAAIGGASGKAAKEGLKAGAGISNKTPGQVATSVGKAAAVNAAGELGGRFVAKGLKTLRGRLPDFVAGTTEESRELTKRTLEGGARPPTTSTLPTAKRLQRVEILANKLVGPSKIQRDANLNYINNRTAEILESTGLSRTEADSLITKFDDVPKTADTRSLGNQIQQAAQAKVNMLTENLDKVSTEATQTINGTIDRLLSRKNKFAPGDLGADVGAGLAQARQTFYETSAKLASDAEKLAGNISFPTNGLKAAARALLKRNPELGIKEAPVLRSILEEYPENMTFRQANDLRTQFTQLAESNAVLKNTQQKEYQKLLDAVNLSIKSTLAKPGREQALAALQKADNFWEQGARKFEDASTKRLLQLAQAGYKVDPAVVANLAFRPGSTTRVAELKQILGRETFARVAAQDFRNIIEEATTIDGAVSGKKLLDILESRKSQIAEIHGPETAAQLREAALGLASKDRLVPPEALQPGKIRDVIVGLRQAEKEFDNYMKDNFLLDLADPKKDPEQVYQYLATPGNGSRLDKVVKIFGENSPQVQGLRQQATVELVKNASFQGFNGQGAAGIRKALGQYTEFERKTLFPNGLDKDIELLGKEVEFLFPKPKDESAASITAGSIMERVLPRRVFSQVNHAAWRYLLQDPKIIRRLALGIQQEGEYRLMAREAIRRIVQYSIVEGSYEDPEEQSSAGTE